MYVAGNEMIRYLVIVRDSTLTHTKCKARFNTEDEAHEYYKSKLQPYGFELIDILKEENDLGDGTALEWSSHLQ